MSGRPDFKIGDTIRYRGCFGMDHTPSTATITGMTLSENPRDKYGARIEECTRDQIRQNRVVFDLSDHHWCYSEQVLFV